MVKHSLTVSTRKKDLHVIEVSFKEQEKPGNKEGTNWRVALPLQFTSALTKTDSVTADGYLKYRLDISVMQPETTTVYGNFTVKTNQPKKSEVTINGVILERERGPVETNNAAAPVPEKKR